MRKLNNPLLIAITLVLVFITSALFVFNNTNGNDENEVASTVETDVDNQESMPELSSDATEVAALNPDDYKTDESASDYVDNDKAFTPSTYDPNAVRSGNKPKRETGSASYDQSPFNDPVESADMSYDSYATQHKGEVSESSQPVPYSKEQKPITDSTTPHTDNQNDAYKEASNTDIGKSTDNVELESEEASQAFPNHAKAEKSSEAKPDFVQDDIEASTETIETIQHDSYDSPETTQPDNVDTVGTDQPDVDSIMEDVEQVESGSDGLQSESDVLPDDSGTYEDSEDSESDNYVPMDDPGPDNYEPMDDSESDNYDPMDDSEPDNYDPMDDSSSHDTTDSAEIDTISQQPNQEQIITILTQSIISESGTFASYIDREDWERRSIGSFGEQHTNCFSVGTGASYNMWGGGTQSVSFNITDLNDYQFLNFIICGENGTDGEMEVDIYIDREMEGEPDYNYHFSSCTIPAEAKIDIHGASFISILVNNLSNNENRMVFYDLSVSDV